MVENPHTLKDIRYHDTIAPEYEQIVLEPRRTVNERVFAFCEDLIRPGHTMVDLGCGAGHASVRFGQKFRRILAIDHSEAMQRRAWENLRQAGINHAALMCGDAATFLEHHDSNGVDAFFSIGFLHHLTPADIRATFQQVSRILKLGGYFLLMEPREIDPASVPAEIAAWNAASLAPQLVYSREPEYIPDEKPIPERELFEEMANAGLTPKYHYRYWEIFPRALPVREPEAAEILALHERHHETGNCVLIIAEKPVS